MRISDWSSDVCSSDLLGAALPDRLAQVLAERLALPGELGAQSDRKLTDAEARLKRWTFHPNGTERFAKAEGTAGGISTAGLAAQPRRRQSFAAHDTIGEHRGVLASRARHTL